MIDYEKLKPPCLEQAIDEIEFMIQGAKDDRLPNQWLCDFIGRPLFGLQLWAVGRVNIRILESLEQFIKELESAIPIYKMQINRLQEMMGEEND